MTTPMDWQSPERLWVLYGGREGSWELHGPRSPMALVCWATLSITKGCPEGSDSMLGSTPQYGQLWAPGLGLASDTEIRPGTVDTELTARPLLSHTS